MEKESVSIAGIAFTLELQAYNRLNIYLRRLNTAYSANPKKEDILYDIETRIADLILSKQSSRLTVTIDLISEVIEQMPSPEDVVVEATPKIEQPTREPKKERRGILATILNAICSITVFGIKSIFIFILIIVAIYLLLMFLPMILFQIL